MLSYLQGQDLWELVGGSEATQPAEDENGTLRKWKIKAGKAMFALKTTIKEEMLEHIRDVDRRQHGIHWPHSFQRRMTQDYNF